MYDLECNAFRVWKVGSLSYTDHPGVGTVHYTLSTKPHGLFWTPILSSEFLSIGKLASSQW